jgi:hypothetical protein
MPAQWIQSFFFGKVRGMAHVQMFRAPDAMRFVPSGPGGWGFEWFSPQPQVDRPERFEMRLAYAPTTDRVLVWDLFEQQIVR